MTPSPQKDLKGLGDPRINQPTKTLPLLEQPNGGEAVEITLESLLDHRYLLERELGRGGGGVVYFARDQKLHHKPVVVKFLLGERRRDEWFHKKFRDEIAALARLNHPSIVGILDAGQTPEGIPFLVMQYVDGVTLRSLIHPGGMPLDRAGHILLQIGQALAAAHARGVCHRDLKPENIMIQPTPNGDLVWLIDFGISTIREEGFEGGSEITRVAGSVAYMAPEQFRGRPTAASDIYAMGIIAWELLAGIAPLRTSSAPSAVLDELRQLRPGLPEGAVQAIGKAIAVEPAERFQSAIECANQLASALSVSRSSGSSRTLSVQQRAFDVAMARQIPLYKPAEVLALIRRTESGGLAAILEIERDISVTKEEVRSKPFEIEFPQGPTGPRAMELGLRLDCPDFTPQSASKTMLVSPTGDSDICTFLITPMHLGELRVNVELTRGDVLLASRALRTEATPSDRKLADTSSVLVSIPLSVIVRPSDGVVRPLEPSQVGQLPALQGDYVLASQAPLPTAKARVGRAKRSGRRALGITSALVVIVAVLIPSWLGTRKKISLPSVAEVTRAPELPAPAAANPRLPQSESSVPGVKPPPLNARDLFYASSVNTIPGIKGFSQQTAKPGAQDLTPLGLRYTVQILSKSGNGSTLAVDVPPDTVFHAGDRIRLIVESNGSGYLYVVSHGSTGAWTVLFPSKIVADGSNRIEKGKLQTLPAGATWVFDEHPGTEKLLLILTRTPLPDLNAVIYANGQLAATSVSDDLVRQVRNKSPRSQILAKSSVGINGKPELATYAVNPSTASDADVIVDLSLNHQ